MTKPIATSQRQRDFLGMSFTALCGGALALNLVLILGLLALIGWQGGRYFWQKDLIQVELTDGRKLLGEVHSFEEIPASAGGGTRFQLKVGNRDISGNDFVWVSDADVRGRSLPDDAVVVERLEWGNFYGRPVEISDGDRVLASGVEPVWAALPGLLERKRAEREAIRELEKGAIGDVNFEIEKLRLAERRLELEQPSPAVRERRTAEIAKATALRHQEYERLASRLFEMRAELDREKVVLETADGQRKQVPVGAIVHAHRPNEMTAAGKLGLYLSRVVEFVIADPRESNTEGGIFMVILGTLVMTMVMSVLVVPFGVIAALYLREYAKQGWMVSMVRIAVNNLAGVPSIVFGIFGFGLFCVLVGKTIDEVFFPEMGATPTFGGGGVLWASLTLALLTVPVVIVATEEALIAVPSSQREASLACGASRFQTIRKVILPQAMPGVLTGLILAMARGAGEVAPLMIVGVVKYAPYAPVDGVPPFLHLERKFMHLGFHIYDLGFQSPNAENTKPLVFTTTLVLIALVALLNVAAITIRNRIRSKMQSSHV